MIEEWIFWGIWWLTGFLCMVSLSEKPFGWCSLIIIITIGVPSICMYYDVPFSFLIINLIKDLLNFLYDILNHF